MGGYNSGGRNRCRITAEACWKVDTAMLRRAGLIHPDAAKIGMLTFTQCGAAAIVLEILATPDNPAYLRFTLVVPKQGRHEQTIRLSFTDCNYGGASRAWFQCPLCRRRVFRLFYYDHTWNGPTQVHYLACRHCWRLTYNLRRERGSDLYQSKVMKAGKKLEHWAVIHGDNDYLAALKDYDWRDLPPKPSWMRLDTYDRIATKFEDALETSETMFYSRILGMLGDVPA